MKKTIYGNVVKCYPFFYELEGVYNKNGNRKEKAEENIKLLGKYFDIIIVDYKGTGNNIAIINPSGPYYEGKKHIKTSFIEEIEEGDILAITTKNSIYRFVID